MLNTLNIGIDISLRKAAVSFLTQEGKYLGKTFEIDNNLPGFENLKEKTATLISQQNFQHIRLGLEASSLYGFHLTDYFTNNPLRCETQVYLINAKYISRFKKAFPEKEKTDLTDAQFIAEYLRFGKLPVEYKPELLHLPLKRLVRYRYHLVKLIEREKKLFLANLFLMFPGWVQNKPIAHLGATSLTILNELSPDEIVTMPLEELALLVAKAGKNRSPDPKSIAENIQKAARESYRIRPQLANSCQLILASITKTLSALKKSLKEIDKAIAEEGKGFINPLLSIKGIGPVYAAGILASIGEIRRFLSDDKLARFAGLVWKRNQSGLSESEERHLVQECDKYFRYYLIEAANSLRVHNEEYQIYYQKKYMEVTKHNHKRALVLSARKLVRLVFALLSKNQLYDPVRAVSRPSRLKVNIK
ncbi:MAG: IS110 family transposase [bacterium]